MTKTAGPEQVLSPEVLALIKQCRTCKATCCTYLTIPLDDPEDLDDYEAVRWYLTRPNTSVYVDEEGDWFVQVDQKCQFLNEDYSCGNYERRPKTCADHDPTGCEYWGDPHEDNQHNWTSFDAFDKYYQAEVKPKLLADEAKEAKKRSARARKAAKARWAKKPAPASKTRAAVKAKKKRARSKAAKRNR